MIYGMLIPGKFEPFSKNPSIAKFFVQMACAKDLGTGINNVYRFLKPYVGTKPIFKEEDIFIVEIPLLRKVSDKVSDNLTDNQTKIIDLINENNKISLSQIAENIGISKRNVLGNINKLKNKNIIKRIGETRTGYWFITDRVADKVPDKVSDGVTTNQHSIINLIQTNKKISMSQMAEKIGISKRKILDNIDKLREKNIVNRIGEAKSGYWKIVK